MVNPATPWHHKLIAALAMLFYLIGALDYAATKLGLAASFGPMTEEQLIYFRGLATWIDVIWAVSVWGGLLGGYLLWQRNRLAVILLFISFAGIAFLTVWLSILGRPSLFGVVGFLGVYVLATTAGMAFLIYLYARWERTEKILS